MFEDNQRTVSNEIFSRQNIVPLSEDPLKIILAVDEVLIGISRNRWNYFLENLFFLL